MFLRRLHRTQIHLFPCQTLAFEARSDAIGAPAVGENHVFPKNPFLLGGTVLPPRLRHRFTLLSSKIWELRLAFQTWGAAGKKRSTVA